MGLEDAVTKEAVTRACAELGLRDWGRLQSIVVTADEAQAILNKTGGEARNVPLDDFREGLQIELEHGTRYAEANVTNNHPLLTGKIVLAHLKESLLYYKRLVVVELEGDLLKATKAGDAQSMLSLYDRVVRARHALSQAEARYLRSG